MTTGKCQRTREFPLLAQRLAEVAVVGAVNRALGHAKVDQRFTVAIKLHVAEHLHQLGAVGLQRNHDADVMHKPAEKRFIARTHAGFFGEQARRGCHGNRVIPKFLGIETVAKCAATKQFGETGGDRNVLDGVEAQHRDRAIDRSDLSWKTVERAVHDLENARRKRGIPANQLIQIVRARVRILHELNDAQGDLGQSRNVTELFHGRMRDQHVCVV